VDIQSILKDKVLAKRDRHTVLRAGLSLMAAMKSKNKNERHELTSDELQRMEQYVELQNARLEVIELLDNYSGDFADWSIIISNAVLDVMARKQQANEDCEKERTMLENLSYVFPKLSFHSAMLADWHNQMTFRIKNTEKMIDDGHL
jgi:hypothetical protein